MDNLKKIKQWGGLIILVAIIGFLGLMATTGKLNPPKIDIAETVTEDEPSFGKPLFGDGTIDGIDTSTTLPTLIVSRNTGRKELIITNAGSEAIFLWRRNFTSANAASSTINRVAGIYLGANGGSYDINHKRDGDIWTGDIWSSTTTAAQRITYDEKNN